MPIVKAAMIAAATTVLATCVYALAWAQDQGRASTAAPSDGPPAWLFMKSPPAQSLADPDQVRRIPGSEARFTNAQTHDLFAPPDWFPREHAPMPPIVAHGVKPAISACGYCHLPNGQGRPENASLAGLPARYLAEQMEDFKTGVRKSTDGATSNGMVAIAKVITPADTQAAADYFAGLRYRPWIQVIESATAPTVEVETRMAIPAPGGGIEPLGERIVETTRDVDRTRLRDPHFGFVAYVPIGSLKTGEGLVLTGAGKTQACEGCHGKGLIGSSIAPPLAGRSPSYMLRQMYDVQHGLRGGAAEQAMAPVLSKLTMKDMIAIAAYAASLKPEG